MLLAVADDDGQVVVQDETGHAILGHDGKALARHQRSADPGKKSIKKAKDKGSKNRKKELKKTKKNSRKSSKGRVNKKGKRNNRNGKRKKKVKKVNGKNKKKKGRKNKKDKKPRKSKKVKKNKKIQKKRKIGRRIQKRKEKKEQRQGKEKRKGKKNKKRTKKEKRNKLGKDSTCLPLVCVDNAVKAMNMLKGKVFSFEKQLKRFGKMSTQAVKKVGKKGVFKPTLMRLIDQGGGNASGLSCGGNMTNAGALQMQNLSSLLTACEGQVFFGC